MLRRIKAAIKKVTLGMTKQEELLVEIMLIVNKWPLGKMVRFADWLRENKDSDNMPWDE